MCELLTHLNEKQIKLFKNMFMLKELISVIPLDLNWSDIHCEDECLKYIAFFYVG